MVHPLLFGADETDPRPLGTAGAAFGTTHWSVVGACRDGDEMAPGASPAALTGFVAITGHPSIVSSAGAVIRRPTRRISSRAFSSIPVRARLTCMPSAARGSFDPPPSFDQALPGERLGPRACPQARRRLRIRPSRHGGGSRRGASSLRTRNRSPTTNKLINSAGRRRSLRCALAHLGEEFPDGAKARLFSELKPFLCGGAGLPGQAEVAARLEMPIGTLRSHLLRLRVRYAELLREEVARTIGTADDVDEELRHFRNILIG